MSNCLDCGYCESCIDRSIAAAEEHDPDDFGEEAEMEMECPHCNEGWVSANGIQVECGECGGNGWY